VPNPKELFHIPLSSFCYNQAQELQHSLDERLSAAGLLVRDERPLYRPPVNQKIDDDSVCATILSTIWLGVAKPVLDGLGFSVRHTPLIRLKY
jgi:hypothetical protein